MVRVDACTLLRVDACAGGTPPIFHHYSPHFLFRRVVSVNQVSYSIQTPSNIGNAGKADEGMRLQWKAGTTGGSSSDCSKALVDKCRTGKAFTVLGVLAIAAAIGLTLAPVHCLAVITKPCPLVALICCVVSIMLYRCHHSALRSNTLYAGALSCRDNKTMPPGRSNMLCC